MYTHDDIRLACGDAALAYSRNKNRGGRANASGASYEAVYATYKIALLAAAELMAGGDGSSIVLEDQVSGFIDDLMIEGVGKPRNSQLKDVKQLNWTSGDHPIEEDFKLQEKLDKYHGRKSAYELVVSSPSIQASLLRTKDKHLSVKVRRFSGGTAAEVGLYHPALRAAISTISIRQPNAAAIEAVFNMLLGAWVTSPPRCTLRQIVCRIANQRDSLIAPLEPPYTLPNEIRHILGSIDIKQYGVRKNRFFCDFGPIVDYHPYHCYTQEFADFMADLRASPPSAASDLLMRIRG